MYYSIDLQTKVEKDGVESRRRLHCFTQALYASISDPTARKKERNLNNAF
jgi:hypothetical protein